MKLLFLLLLATISSFTVSAQPGTGIVYEKRTDILSAPNCNPSETYLKKKVKALIATTYKEDTKIAVEFTSFKGKKG